MSLPKPQDPRAIHFVTLHCTASAYGHDLTAAQISAEDTRIWGQVSYHYVIERSGKVTQTLRHDQIGAHVAKHNTGNIGISYVGGLGPDGKAADTRTPAQHAALEHLVRTLRHSYPAAKILGHRDWSPDANHDGRIEPYEWLKSCPCFEVAAWLKDIGL